MKCKGKKKKTSKTKHTEDMRAVTTGKGLGWGSETGEGDQEIIFQLCNK